VVNRVNDLACVDSLEINRRDAEVRMPELPLDNRQWDPFVRHLDCVRMTQCQQELKSAPVSGTEKCTAAPVDGWASGGCGGLSRSEP
jgi:hypothetical protein